VSSTYTDWIVVRAEREMIPTTQRRKFGAHVHLQVLEKLVVLHRHMVSINVNHRIYYTVSQKTNHCTSQHKIDFNVDVYVTIHLKQGMTLTFDLQNLTRSSVGASEYSHHFYQNCSCHS